MTSTRVLVVIPTYDEAASIERTIAAVLDAAPEVDVLVVDDNSPDGTADLVDALTCGDDRIHVLRRLRKAGLGPAYLDGFAWARRNGVDVVIEFDADGSHPALRIPALLDALAADAGLGVAIGSRWVPGGRLIGWPRRREWLSRAANAYARVALGVRVRDLTAGFRAYRLTALEGVDVGSVDSVGYCFQVDLTLRVLDAGWRVVELPIVFRERAAGTSKMTGDIVREAMSRITVWALQRRIRAFRRGTNRGGAVAGVVREAQQPRQPQPSLDPGQSPGQRDEPAPTAQESEPSTAAS